MLTGHVLVLERAVLRVWLVFGVCHMCSVSGVRCVRCVYVVMVCGVSSVRCVSCAYVVMMCMCLKGVFENLFCVCACVLGVGM